jgi:ABC-type amino acid transport substrate-binding protein
MNLKTLGRTILAGTAIIASTVVTQAATLEDIKARGKLLVAIDIGLPPFGTVDAQMQPTGSDVEAARLLAAHLGVPLEIVPATGPSRIPLLLTGKVDAVMSSFSVTEERKKVVAFSLPYGIIQIVCAAPKALDWTSPLSVESVFSSRSRRMRPFERCGADIAEARMTPAWVIEAFDVMSNRAACLVA